MMMKYEINGTITVAAENEAEARSRYAEELLAGPIESIEERGEMNLMERQSMIYWEALSISNEDEVCTEEQVSALLQGLRSDDGIPETGDVETIVCSFRPETLKDFHHGCACLTRWLPRKERDELVARLRAAA